MPRGAGFRAKTSLSLEWSSRCLRIDGRQSELSEVGARMGVLGSMSQMWTVLMATLESVSRRQRMRDRLPCGPPSASRASSSSPQPELIMCGVQVSAPTRSRVRCAKIVAMSLRSPGKETGALLKYVLMSKEYIIASRLCRSRFLNAASMRVAAQESKGRPRTLVQKAR